MHWPHGPFGREINRVPRERRGEPFAPRLPRFLLEHPTLSGGLMALTGFFGNWVIASQMEHWPDWTLFPGVILACLCLISMVIGLGLVVVRALEPALANVDLDWDAEPLAALAIPPVLQRKCESLGFWAADDLVRAIERGKFPWTQLEYDERMQLERAAHRWSAAERASAGKPKRGRRTAAAGD